MISPTSTAPSPTAASRSCATSPTAAASLAVHDVAARPAGRTACDERVIDHDLLAKLVRELDDAHCEVLAYRYLDDMTQEEIAELTGLSRKTIGKRLDRIRDAVRRLADASPPAAGSDSGGGGEESGPP